MKFMLTNCTTEERFSVTRECADRVKGSTYINSLIKQVERSGEPVETNFEGDYDLKIERGNVV